MPGGDQGITRADKQAQKKAAAEEPPQHEQPEPEPEPEPASRSFALFGLSDLGDGELMLRVLERLDFRSLWRLRWASPRLRLSTDMLERAAEAILLRAGTELKGGAGEGGALPWSSCFSVDEPMRVVRTGGQTCLDALNELESVLTLEESDRLGVPHRPLEFSGSTSARTKPKRGATVTLTDMTLEDKGFATIVCTDAPMKAGVHHAEFAVRTPKPWCSVGIVRGFDGRRGFDVSSAGKVRPSESPHGFGWTMTGTVGHNKSPNVPVYTSDAAWKAGDSLGLRIDLSRLTLTAFKNGQRLGVFVRGADLCPAAGGWCWMVEMLHVGSCVEIGRRRPLATHEEAVAAEGDRSREIDRRRSAFDGPGGRPATAVRGPDRATLLRNLRAVAAADNKYQGVSDLGKYTRE